MCRYDERAENVARLLIVTRERYHEYRLGCGRDRRLEQLWGKPERELAH